MDTCTSVQNRQKWRRISFRVNKKKRSISSALDGILSTGVSTGEKEQDDGDDEHDYHEHGNTLLLRKLGIRRRRWRGWEDIAAAWAEGFGIHLVCAAFGTFHVHRSFQT
jgi:hypothetical protein